MTLIEQILSDMASLYPALVPAGILVYLGYRSLIAEMAWYREFLEKMLDEMIQLKRELRTQNEVSRHARDPQ